ncbi:MAG: hypothetical protein JWL64_1320 [Frankiales bacterium]|nr:hypothetical protein [Frankiales bacterium]
MRAMTGVAELGIALLMLVGLVGVVIPLIPGTALVLAAGLLWTVADGGGSRWVWFVVMALLFGAGLVLKYVLPGRQLAGGLSRTTAVAGVVGASVGFFVLPVVGLPVGGVAGVYLAEYARLGSVRPAWQGTLLVLRAIGLGVLVELAAGLLMTLVWLGAVLAT